MHTDVNNWRALMKEGRPVSETIDTIFRVIHAEKPEFWNPTERRVRDNFGETYCDPTGERFSKGPIFSLKPQKLPIEMTLLGKSYAINKIIYKIPTLSGSSLTKSAQLNHQK
jgi:hypothetical protein